MKKWVSVLIIIVIGAIFLMSMSPQEESQKISPDKAKEMLQENRNVVLLDVRTPEEYAQGHIPRSQLVPLDELDQKIESIIPDKDTKIIIYCRSGNRSKTAVNLLINKGYTNVYDLGGIIDWPYEVE